MTTPFDTEKKGKYKIQVNKVYEYEIEADNLLGAFAKLIWAKTNGIKPVRKGSKLGEVTLPNGMEADRVEVMFEFDKVKQGDKLKIK